MTGEKKNVFKSLDEFNEEFFPELSEEESVEEEEPKKIAMKSARESISRIKERS